MMLAGKATGPAGAEGSTTDAASTTPEAESSRSMLSAWSCSSLRDSRPSMITRRQGVSGCFSDGCVATL